MTERVVVNRKMLEKALALLIQMAIPLANWVDVYEHFKEALKINADPPPKE